MNLPRLHPEVCANGPWGHNNRCRFTHGFECWDCGAWVSKTDPVWYFTNSLGAREETTVRYGRPEIPEPR